MSTKMTSMLRKVGQYPIQETYKALRRLRNLSYWAL